MRKLKEQAYLPEIVSFILWTGVWAVGISGILRDTSGFFNPQHTTHFLTVLAKFAVFISAFLSVCVYYIAERQQMWSYLFIQVPAFVFGAFFASLFAPVVGVFALLLFLIAGWLFVFAFVEIIFSFVGLQLIVNLAACVLYYTAIGKKFREK